MQVLCHYGLVEAKVENEYKVESTGYGVHAVVYAWISAVLNAEYNNA